MKRNEDNDYNPHRVIIYDMKKQQMNYNRIKRKRLAKKIIIQQAKYVLGISKMHPSYDRFSSALETLKLRIIHYDPKNGTQECRVYKDDCLPMVKIYKTYYSKRYDKNHNRNR